MYMYIIYYTTIIYVSAIIKQALVYFPLIKKESLVSQGDAKLRNKTNKERASGTSHAVM